MHQECERMAEDDVIDAERIILENTLESDAYSLGYEFKKLKRTRHISSYYETQCKTTITYILSWFKDDQQAPLEEYRTRLHQMENLLEMTSRMVENSNTPIPSNEDKDLRPQGSKTCQKAAVKF
jgi:hypothetical protein